MAFGVVSHYAKAIALRPAVGRFLQDSNRA
jgi:hypothetical protein